MCVVNSWVSPGVFVHRAHRMCWAQLCLQMATSGGVEMCRHGDGSRQPHCAWWIRSGGERDCFLNLVMCASPVPVIKSGTRNCFLQRHIDSQQAGNPFLPSTSSPKHAAWTTDLSKTLCAYRKQLKQTVLHHFMKECLDKLMRVDFLPAWASHWSLKNSWAWGAKQRAGNH